MIQKFLPYVFVLWTVLRCSKLNFVVLYLSFLCYQCSWSNYRYYPELLLFYTIRVHSVALAFLNLISYESLVLLDERYPTLKHYLFTVNITYAFLLFFMLSSIWHTNVSLQFLKGSYLYINQNTNSNTRINRRPEN